MEVTIQANHIGAQTLIETVERGDVILGNADLALSDADRRRVVGRLLEKLEEQVGQLPTSSLEAAEQHQLLSVAEQVATAANDNGEESRAARVEGFLKTLKSCFGSTADVITTAINLAKVLSSVA